MTALPANTPTPMTVEQFIAWSLKHDVRRAELYGGEPVLAQAQTLRHSQRKVRAFNYIEHAILQARLPCRPMMEMLVPINGMQSGFGFEPDLLVQCGEAPAPDTVIIPDPLIVIEIVSPSSGRIDTVLKTSWYFAVPSVQHYLIVEPKERVLVWHARRPEPEPIATRILREGSFTLDPPGLRLDVAALVGAEAA